MLNKKQLKFCADLLSPFKQKIYFFRNLPMGLISGIRLIQLDEEKSVSEVPFRWCNKNPFKSMYFAVQSMAAELSTAALVMLALNKQDANVALIIVNMKVDFVKKAQTKVVFSCHDYDKILHEISKLSQLNDVAVVTVKTIGKDMNDNEVALFYFTWSFKRRS